MKRRDIFKTAIGLPIVALTAAPRANKGSWRLMVDPTGAWPELIEIPIEEHPKFKGNPEAVAEFRSQGITHFLGYKNKTNFYI